MEFFQSFHNQLQYQYMKIDDQNDANHWSIINDYETKQMKKKTNDNVDDQ